MSMVFCRGCGKEIHETAPTCPNCGALQNLSYSQRQNLSVVNKDSEEGLWFYYLKVLKKIFNLQKILIFLEYKDKLIPFLTM